jgi:hypothetical protein
MTNFLAPQNYSSALKSNAENYLLNCFSGNKETAVYTELINAAMVITGGLAWFQPQNVQINVQNPEQIDDNEEE